MILRINKPEEIAEIVSRQKESGKKIGFVPTMGALHQGHLSLVERSCAENSFTIVSIFVNPTQFNDQEDFRRYPRNIHQDIELLKNTCTQVVFSPEVEDIYPGNKYEMLELDLDGLDKVLEGAYRPGHFAGVVTIVKKLFDIVRPDSAYFGLKDYQQYLIIRKMVDKLGMNIRIVPCETMREADGLAMSSRNTLLNAEEREFAPNIYKTLLTAQEMLKNKTVLEIKNQSINFLIQSPLVKLDYFEIVDANDLRPVRNIAEHQEIVICTALKVGKIRLIDNVKVRIS